MRTSVKVERVETNSKYYPEVHLHFKDYRGNTTIKLDEKTARLLVTDLDVKINWTQKIIDEVKDMDVR